MAGQQDQRRSVTPIGERHARCGSGCGRGGDPRDDLDVDAGRAERLDLFRRAPEDQRIASLQPDDGKPLTGVTNHHIVDRLLTEGLCPMSLPDALHARAPRSKREDLG